MLPEQLHIHRQEKGGGGGEKRKEEKKIKESQPKTLSSNKI